MRALAAEMNLSETAFVVPDGAGAFGLRWFTPTAEVALCGHATLASGHYLLRREGAREVSFRTRQAGVLTVSREADGYALDDEEFLPGLLCLAVLVPSPAGLSNLSNLCVAVQAPVMRLTAAKAKQLLPALQRAALALSRIDKV